MVLLLPAGKDSPKVMLYIEDFWGKISAYIVARYHYTSSKIKASICLFGYTCKIILVID